MTLLAKHFCMYKQQQIISTFWDASLILYFQYSEMERQ